ncbi:MAG TPA: hypothetical protein VEK10_07205 [Steroidobacteraceae bacterium]|nr:hypothetical protein [Steroidobacteraceae bacterium]
MKRLSPLLLLSLPVWLTVSASALAENGVHAVMYALIYDVQSLEITHAQVVGGYRNLDVCRKAMPSVVAASSSQLKSNERLRLDCSGGRPVEAVPLSRNPSA